MPMLPGASPDLRELFECFRRSAVSRQRFSAHPTIGASRDTIRALRPSTLLEEDVARLTDDELKLRTENFRRQLAEGATVDDLLVPAFATVREAAKRTLGQRHFDVQLIGGMVLHEGKIAEMKTGEGKTLVATLPVYLNALAGKGVHVVTVNDYLAQRDADWMGQIYTFLGLTVGKIVHGLDDEQRKAAYACDVTYGTNNELGFDYLRDNMKMDMDEMVQRGHSFAIVDEVDSILIDEARTPLIISGPLEDRADLYQAVDEIIPTLAAEDFELDEKQRQVSLTEAGNERVEVLLAEKGLMKGSLYDIENVSLVHHINSALKAHKLFQRDRDYIVKGGEVVIIDEFTGRMMPGRRYSEGLHQALEAKERVEIQPENQTLASITFQNYFRLYKKLAGMTGTASTEASEFLDIYGLDVLEIPTNVAVGRVDDDDEIYRTAKEKYAAIVQTIADCHRRNQPILVGTVSIEKSEQLSALLKDKKYIQELGRNALALADKLKEGKEGELKEYLADMGSYLVELGSRSKANADPVPHRVLNARHHEQEARIVAQAGVPGAVTIATNMAGRGTDIQLGGNVEARLKDWIADETEAGRAPDEAQIAKTRERLVADVAEKKQTGARSGRALRARHRAPREPPHRQPVARPLRPPGRSGPLQVLPGARRRPDAHLRLQSHGQRIEDARPAGRRSHHASVDEQVAGDGAEEGRGAQLRHPQADPQVRRRDERPAQGHLRAAARHHGRDRRLRDGEGPAPSARQRTGAHAHSRDCLRRAVEHQGAARGHQRRLRPRPADRRLGPPRKASPTRRSPSASSPRWMRRRRAKPPSSVTKTSVRSKRWCCCRPSITSGASISSRWSTCAR